MTIWSYSAYLSVLVFYPLVNYSVVVTCALLIHRFVRRNYKGPSDAQRRLVNRQITLTMIIQVEMIYSLNRYQIF
jgi:hypothetical protein